MSRAAGAAIAALFMCAPAWGQSCTIATDGYVSTFLHELAHCNGWQHEPFVPNMDPPLEFLHPYDGKLMVWFTGMNSPEREPATMLYAQPGTQFGFKYGWSVASICHWLWQKRGIPVATSEDMNRLIGCAVDD